MRTSNIKSGLITSLISCLMISGTLAQRANTVVLLSDEQPAVKIEMLKSVFQKLGYLPEVSENEGTIITDYHHLPNGSDGLEMKFKAMVTIDKILLQGFYLDPLWKKEVLITRENHETDNNSRESWRELVKLSLLIGLAETKTN